MRSAYLDAVVNARCEVELALSGCRSSCAVTGYLRKNGNVNKPTKFRTNDSKRKASLGLSEVDCQCKYEQLGPTLISLAPHLAAPAATSPMPFGSKITDMRCPINKQREGRGTAKGVRHTYFARSQFDGDECIWIDYAQIPNRCYGQ